MFSFQELGLDENAGIALFGARTVVRQGVRIEEPAYGLAALEGFLRHVGRQDDDAMVRVLRDAGLTGPAVNLFASLKTVIRMDDPTGGRLYADVRVPGVADDSISNYAGSEAFGEIKYLPGEVVDDRQLTYRLNAIFNDVTVSDKLQISEKRIQVAKRLLVSDPVAAAKSLTAYIQGHGFPNAKVVAGEFAKTVARAKIVIREFANMIEYRDTMAYARITPTNMRITYDGLDGGTPQWTVIGPLKYATECQAIYQMAIKHGPDTVMFMLGVETAMLTINILNEETHEYYTGTVYGYSSLSGVQPIGATYPSELTADQKMTLAAAARKVTPVLVDGVVVGTAVQVSDRHVILNEHTADSVSRARVDGYVCGELLADTQSVSHDICVVRRTGITARWVLRQPEVGERVVLCYSVGSNDVEYSEVLRVNSSTSEHILLSESAVLRKGTSGAAVVALRDGALLGVFSTIRGRDVVCALFSSLAFRDVTDLESVFSDVPVTPGSEVNRTYEHMVKRGFLSFLEGINAASTAVYSTGPRGRVNEGTVANWAGQWVTTVDPDVAQLSLSDGQLLSFRSARESYSVVVSPPPILSQLPNVRTVQPGERVFAFVKAGDEVALTPMRTVVHCKLDVRQFSVDDFGESEEPMAGALIVAERDAAVVGLYAGTSVDAYGTVTASCHSLVAASRASSVAPSEAHAFEASGLVDSFERIYSDRQALQVAVSFGNALLESVASIYSARSSAPAQTVQRYRAAWQSSYERMLLTIGWQRTDWSRFEAVPAVDVAAAYLAVAFTREPSYFITRLFNMFVEYSQEDRTPVVAEFPFPVNPPGGRRSTSVDSVERLKELEEKVRTLARRVEEG